MPENVFTPPTGSHANSEASQDSPTWVMPSETAPHDRIWMAFPRQNETLGANATEAAAGYQAWADVANAIAAHVPVTMVADPTEIDRAKRMVDGSVEFIEAPLDDFWMRDIGATFVHGAGGRLGAVDWLFTGWGADDPTEYARDNRIAGLMAERTGAVHIPSLLANEGGGIHVDGAGTVLLTDTVQLDPKRNPLADKARVEAELFRTIGATHAVWVPRGLTRDYDELGTKGHIDILATIPSSGTVLVHSQRDENHPDAEVSREIRQVFERSTDAAGNPWRIVELPAPATLRDEHGFVDWSYVNHLVTNGIVIACGFGEPAADARAAGILSEVYPDRQVITVDAREIFARGGGVHCITQQQPSLAQS